MDGTFITIALWHEMRLPPYESKARIAERRIQLLERSKTMRQLSTVIFVCVILSAMTGLARAGACTDHLKQLRQAAHLAQQPTPEWVGQAQTYGQLMFAAALARAEAHDVLGREAECLMAVRRAKEISEIQ
jgi:hypothetical protein